MTKPVHIPRYNHFQVDPEYDECQFNDDDVGEWVRYSDHVAALLQVREMLEAKAKEWRSNACGMDAPRTDCGYTKCAAELLALAATLGNQGK